MVQSSSGHYIASNSRGVLAGSAGSQQDNSRRISRKTDQEHVAHDTMYPTHSSFYHQRTPPNSIPTSGNLSQGIVYSGYAQSTPNDHGSTQSIPQNGPVYGPAPSPSSHHHHQLSLQIGPGVSNSSHYENYQGNTGYAPSEEKRPYAPQHSHEVHNKMWYPTVSGSLPPAGAGLRTGVAQERTFSIDRDLIRTNPNVMSHNMRQPSQQFDHSAHSSSQNDTLSPGVAQDNHRNRSEVSPRSGLGRARQEQDRNGISSNSPQSSQRPHLPVPNGSSSFVSRFLKSPQQNHQQLPPLSPAIAMQPTPSHAYPSQAAWYDVYRRSQGSGGYSLYHPTTPGSVSGMSGTSTSSFPVVTRSGQTSPYYHQSSHGQPISQIPRTRAYSSGYESETGTRHYVPETQWLPSNSKPYASESERPKLSPNYDERQYGNTSNITPSTTSHSSASSISSAPGAQLEKSKAVSVVPPEFTAAPQLKRAYSIDDKPDEHSTLEDYHRRQQEYHLHYQRNTVRTSLSPKISGDCYNSERHDISELPKQRNIQDESSHIQSTTPVGEVSKLSFGSLNMQNTSLQVPLAVETSRKRSTISDLLSPTVEDDQVRQSSREEKKDICTDATDTTSLRQLSVLSSTNTQIEQSADDVPVRNEESKASSSTGSEVDISPATPATEQSKDRSGDSTPITDSGSQSTLQKNDKCVDNSGREIFEKLVFQPQPGLTKSRESDIRSSLDRLSPPKDRAVENTSPLAITTSPSASTVTENRQNLSPKSFPKAVDMESDIQIQGLPTTAKQITDRPAVKKRIIMGPRSTSTPIVVRPVKEISIPVFEGVSDDDDSDQSVALSEDMNESIDDDDDYDDSDEKEQDLSQDSGDEDEYIPGGTGSKRRRLSSDSNVNTHSTGRLPNRRKSQSSMMKSRASDSNTAIKKSRQNTILSSKNVMAAETKHSKSKFEHNFSAEAAFKELIAAAKNLKKAVQATAPSSPEDRETANLKKQLDFTEIALHNGRSHVANLKLQKDKRDLGRKSWLRSVIKGRAELSLKHENSILRLRQWLKWWWTDIAARHSENQLHGSWGKRTQISKAWQETYDVSASIVHARLRQCERVYELQYRCGWPALVLATLATPAIGPTQRMRKSHLERGCDATQISQREWSEFVALAESRVHEIHSAVLAQCGYEGIRRIIEKAAALKPFALKQLALMPPYTYAEDTDTIIVMPRVIRTHTNKVIADKRRKDGKIKRRETTSS
ncbi:hypothetical protein V1511DRAFT_503548 [Dipodascopsis uninucleata]